MFNPPARKEARNIIILLKQLGKELKLYKKSLLYIGTADTLYEKLMQLKKKSGS